MPGFGLVGSGQLGGAIGRAALRSGFIDPDRFWVANRSGHRKGFDEWPAIQTTSVVQTLADGCDCILLAVPPVEASRLRFRAPGSLVISVMAGIGCDDLIRISGSSRVVRAMSNPAAEIALAYSPWYASPEVDAADKARVRRLFEACGATDEVPGEDQIDVFTAVTGPVPGFVAFFADSMVRYGESCGLEPAIAQRAVKQLFLAAGRLMSESESTAAFDVQAMIDYAGTTAAGLEAMQALGVADRIAEGLEAARLKATTIGRP